MESSTNETKYDWKEIMIIIPALDPPTELLSYVHELLAAGFSRILLVDDGSNELCRPLFHKLSALPGCTVLRHAVNMGKGRALKDAFNSFLTGLPKEELPAGVVTVDSDGQHTVKDVVAIAKRMCEQPSGLILGCCDFSRENVPWKSRSGNRATSALFRLLFGKKLCDTQTGLRGISASFMPKLLELKGERFEYETNMLIWAVRNRIPVEEVSIETVYQNENKGTHFHPVKDSCRIMALMFSTFFKCILASALSFVIDIFLFQLFIFLFAAMPHTFRILLGTVLARLFSSLFNFFVNKSFVFRADSAARLRTMLLGYYGICVLTMLLSAGLVAGIYSVLPLPEAVIKVAVDTALFFFNFRIQQKWIFVSR